MEGRLFYDVVVLVHSVVVEMGSSTFIHPFVHNQCQSTLKLVGLIIRILC